MTKDILLRLIQEESNVLELIYGRKNKRLVK